MHNSCVSRVPHKSWYSSQQRFFFYFFFSDFDVFLNGVLFFLNFFFCQNSHFPFFFQPNKSIILTLFFYYYLNCLLSFVEGPYKSKLTLGILAFPSSYTYQSFSYIIYIRSLLSLNISSHSFTALELSPPIFNSLLINRHILLYANESLS